MSNHLSKSLFSIPRLKKSRSRQQNQPENPTSLCLNALTADDAFLRFAAAPDKPFFSPCNPERNSIIFLCIPRLPRPFLSPRNPKRNLIFSLCISPRPPRYFSPSKSTKGNFIIFPCIPRLPRLFHPRKAPKRILFLTLHSQSAATFFIPVQSRTEFYSLTLHASSLSRGPRLQRCITIFSVLSAAFHHAGHRVSQHAEYIQRSCPKCVAQHRNGEIFPPANATAATNQGAGGSGHTRWIQEKNVSIGAAGGGGLSAREMAAGDILYRDYRQGRGGGDIIILGLSAGKILNGNI